MPKVVTNRGVVEAIARDDLEGVKNALTFRQLKFCEEYALDFNATAAAMRAGYSPNGIEKAAVNLMRHEGVRYYITDLTRSKAAKISIVSPDYIVSRIVAIVNEEGAKNSDKLRGLELLARHLGMLTDKQEITGKDGGAIEIAQRNEEDARTFVNILRTLVSKSSTTNQPAVFEIVDEEPSNDI